MKRIPLFFAALLLTAPLRAESTSAELATQAVSPDPAVAQPAQDQLRARGPAGLDALLRQFRPQIAAHRAGGPTDESWKHLAAALNHVGAQYDNYASGLYWYTDLEKAKQASAETGRPILSLRLLGHLDTDLSCANSRFFRTTLYPNAEVNRLLKERYILHWESVRPVPVVTIDFGDGRQLVRTVTGNSIHYILDSQGRIVDALPGLYNAATFVSELKQAADAVAAFPQEDSAALAAYQSTVEQRLRTAWAADLEKVYPELPFGQMPSVNELISRTQSETWQSITSLHEKETAFDNSSLRLIGNKYPDARSASALAVSKCVVESPLVGALRQLKLTVTADTVRNNYLLRSQILGYLSSTPKLSLSRANDWVYAHIFLTPPNDPWLGLAPANAFAALDNDGKTDPATVQVISAGRSVKMLDSAVLLPMTLK